MKHVPILLATALAIASSGCTTPGSLPGTAAAPALEAEAGQPRPKPRPASAAPIPSTAARTVDDFDTTTASERAEAVSAPAAAGERLLGSTVVSLGSPAQPGIWLETPLVKTPGRGRIVLPATGVSVSVDLIPIDGPPTGGSRLSLAAMRLLGVGLTDLPEVEVYAG